MKSLLICFLFGLFLNIITAQTVTLDLFANGFNNPVDLQNAGDDRLFVVEQGGRIKILNLDGSTNPVLFLNISTLVSNGNEQGLLGLAFHPDYASNGYFYLNYTDTNGDTQISRFTVDAINPDIADPNSELHIISYIQPYSNHNGGCIAFGPDGFLYIASGDGGSGGDPGNRAQNTTLLLGKLLRIDVDNSSGGNNYGIPLDNPFAGSTIDAEEIWAYGLRNPWRFSFDSLNGDLWIGDVGQENIEEIDRATSTEAGLNYGWRCYEGSQPYNTSGCPPMGDLTFPFAEYSSGTGSGNCSVTGGYVNRDSNWPMEYGLYYFADYCSGRIGTVDDLGNIVNYGVFSGSWVSFGVDVNSQLYIVDVGGSIYKISGTVLTTTDFELAQVSLSPNPAADYISLSIENDQIFSVDIIDIKGSMIISEGNLSLAEKNISVSSLSQGLYLVKVISVSGKSVIKKLVIE